MGPGLGSGFYSGRNEKPSVFLSMITMWKQSHRHCVESRQTEV